MNNVLVWLLRFFMPWKVWYYNFYLWSNHWREFRQRVGQAGGWRCAECGKHGRCDVHHKTYAHLWRERARDVQLLCRPCHKLGHR